MGVVSVAVAMNYFVTVFYKFKTDILQVLQRTFVGLWHVAHQFHQCCFPQPTGPESSIPLLRSIFNFAAVF
jgi:hypothetical protein